MSRSASAASRPTGLTWGGAAPQESKNFLVLTQCVGTPTEGCQRVGRYGPLSLVQFTTFDKGNTNTCMWYWTNLNCTRGWPSHTHCSLVTVLIMWQHDEACRLLTSVQCYCCGQEYLPTSMRYLCGCRASSMMGMMLVRFFATLSRSRPDRWENSTA